MSDTEQKALPPLWERFASSEQHVEEGTLVDMGDGISVTIRSIHAKRVRKLEATQMKRDRPKLIAKGFQLGPDEVDANEIELCADAILVGWSGVTDAKAEPMPFSRENARLILKALPAFRREIMTAARIDETFRAAALGSVVVD